MATSGDRCEVAERLRDLPRTADADGCCTAWDVLFALGMKRCDAIGFVNAVDAQRLADLIDPTCRIQDTDHEFEDSVRCDRCHATFNRPWEPFRYCPNCGARVVRGHE